MGQSFTDWELLVVDDASTDDTADVVAAIDDPRVRYVPLGGNFGDQAGPNNAGMLLARGRLIAFLNHDDLWFADHLAQARATLDSTGADLVFARCALARERTTEQLRAGDWEFFTQAAGTRRGRYRPGSSIPASSWVLRRELVARVGFWKPANDVYFTASADWLFRAHRRGVAMRSTGDYGVLVIASGIREDAYRDRAHEEHAYFAAQLRSDPDLLDRVRGAVVDERPVPAGSTAAQARNLRLARGLRRAPHDVLDRGLAVAGVNPAEVRAWYRYRARGGYIRHLTERRGLEVSGSRKGRA
jgi:glycosyltransferase involved in cell wall biosynthesis